ncbi:hypothetical protein P7C70_g1093, partial [Phenoliferia sp. Uapishka_3]
MVPYLAEELLNAITDQLVASIEEDNNTPHAVGPATCLQTTGASLCLVSRRFLPYGRRLLYSHLDSRDVRDCGEGWSEGDRGWDWCFSQRAQHLAEYPHLAGFTKSCTVELQDDTMSQEESRQLGLVLKSCTNLFKFTLLERSFPEPWEDEPGWFEWERRDNSRLALFKCLLDPAINKVNQLRHLNLAMTPTAGYWQRVMDLLRRSPDLRSLDIRGLEEHHLGDTDDPIRAALQLPGLRFFSVTRCHNNFVADIIAASPQLHSFVLHTSQDYSLPAISTPHPTLSNLTIIYTHRPNFRNPIAFETAAQLETLTPFISSFPSITNLSLTFETGPRTRTGTDSDIAPSTPASHLFLASLPHTITTLKLEGPALTPVVLNFASLLPSSRLPLLSKFSPYWDFPSGLASTAWEDLIAVCRACDMEMGGSLGVLDNLQTGAERLESFFVDQKLYRETLIGQHALLEMMLEKVNVCNRAVGLAEIPLSAFPDLDEQLKELDAHVREQREQLDSIKALIAETFA